VESDPEVGMKREKEERCGEKLFFRY